MLRLISPKRAMKIINSKTAWIDEVSKRYDIPAAAIKAILYREMTQIDLLDPIADIVAGLGLFGKHDSSIGHAQIFGHVALEAANYAVDHNLATYESLGIKSDHRLDAGNPSDVKLVWRLLRRSPDANIELAALNLLVAAQEMVGRTDFATFSKDELKLTFTRYNANVKHITPYGEHVYELYRTFESVG